MIVIHRDIRAFPLRLGVGAKPNSWVVYAIATGTEKTVIDGVQQITYE